MYGISRFNHLMALPIGCVREMQMLLLLGSLNNISASGNIEEVKPTEQKPNHRHSFSRHKKNAQSPLENLFSCLLQSSEHSDNISVKLFDSNKCHYIKTKYIHPRLNR